jgi:hypothetical protein
MENVPENSSGRFFTASQPLPTVVLSASPGWLIMSTPWGGVPRLLAPAEKNQITDWDYIKQRAHSHGFCNYSLFASSIIVYENWGRNSPPAHPHTSERHRQNAMLPGAPKGSFITLLSQLQCHAALDMIPSTLVSVDQSPVCCPDTLSTLWWGCQGLDFGGEPATYVQACSCSLYPASKLCYQITSFLQSQTFEQFQNQLLFCTQHWHRCENYKSSSDGAKWASVEEP